MEGRRLDPRVQRIWRESLHLNLQDRYFILGILKERDLAHIKENPDGCHINLLLISEEALQKIFDYVQKKMGF